MVRKPNFNWLYFTYSSLKPTFNLLLGSSWCDNYKKWSNIGFGEEIGIIEIKIYTLSRALPRSNFVSGYGTAKEEGHSHAVDYMYSIMHGQNQLT